MTFGLIVFDKAYLSKVHEFANANGVRTRPLDTVREILVDEDELWGLSQKLPRLVADSHATGEHTFWFLELEDTMRVDRAQVILNGHQERLFRDVFVDEYIHGCRMRVQGVAQPPQKQARLADLAFWPANPREQAAMTSFIETKLLQAA